MTNAGALAISRSRRNRRAATDHNNEPVAVASFLKDGEVATPDMTDPMVQLFHLKLCQLVTLLKKAMSIHTVS